MRDERGPRVFSYQTRGLVDLDMVVFPAIDPGGHFQHASRMANGFVVELNPAGTAFDQFEFRGELGPFVDGHFGVGHHQHAAVGAMHVAFEIGITRARGHVDHRVHHMLDIFRVRKGAMGQDGRLRILLNIDVEVDVLKSLFGQYTKAYMHRFAQLGACFHTDVGINAVLRLIGFHLQAGTTCTPTTLF